MKRKTLLITAGTGFLTAAAAAAAALRLKKGGMRTGDAVSALQLGRKKDRKTINLTTVWSEQADDGPDAVPLPEYPRPQMVRKDWKCLNGWWDYSIRPEGRTMGDPDGKILVPFSPETRRSGVNRILQPKETLWYSRTIHDLEVPDGKRLLLHFGAVDERCTVWWNGAELGSHRNGYLPFTFDITDHVLEGSNQLMLAVQDDTDFGTACRGKQTLNPGGMYYHAQSGIWQTVWLEMVPETYIRDVRITPDFEASEVQLELTVSGSGVSETGVSGPNVSGNDVSKIGETDCADRKDDAASSSTGMEVTIFIDGAEHHFSWSPGMKLRIPVPEPHLWTPDDPYLYPFTICAGNDIVESYFAMRSFGTGKTASGMPCLTLNGEPFFFHGVLDQGYWPESLMTAPADDALLFDIEEMKKAGFNMIRKHVKIEPARWYYHCDRTGMIVWQDMVNGGGPVRKVLETYLPNIIPAIITAVKDNWYFLLSRQDKEARDAFEEDCLEMIRVLYNVPSIGLWTPFNEGWGQFDSLWITERIRKADPTRPVDHASGWFDQGGGDLKSVHNYFRPLKVEKDYRACVLTEYGGINLNIPGHAMSEEVYGYKKSSKEEFPAAFAKLMEEIRSLKEQGLAGAVYTQVSDIEEETNGLLTYDRKAVKLP